MSKKEAIDYLTKRYEHLCTRHDLLLRDKVSLKVYLDANWRHVIQNAKEGMHTGRICGLIGCNWI